ncbi:MAG: hypothetical protein J3Q66DRAFT_432930 [Benniella sp.]|nr:MAG: hypothetical protein J3Q66DRAFT_432930 [Benniella sp.]
MSANSKSTPTWPSLVSYCAVAVLGGDLIRAHPRQLLQLKTCATIRVTTPSIMICNLSISLLLSVPADDNDLQRRRSIVNHQPPSVDCSTINHHQLPVVDCSIINHQLSTVPRATLIITPSDSGRFLQLNKANGRQAWMTSHDHKTGCKPDQALTCMSRRPYGLWTGGFLGAKCSLVAPLPCRRSSWKSSVITGTGLSDAQNVNCSMARGFGVQPPCPTAMSNRTTYPTALCNALCPTALPNYPIQSSYATPSVPLSNCPLSNCSNRSVQPSCGAETCLN